jgi:hypothetical protein
MDLIVLCNFMHELNSIRKHYSKNDYTPKHILFSTISLLQEKKLNPKKNSKQKIIISNFVQAKEYGMIMYENFQCMNMHLFCN